MIDPEIQLVGLLLTFPEAVDECELSGLQFSDWELGQLYEALLTLGRSGVPINDVRTVIRELEAMQVPPACLEVSYLGRLIHQAGSRAGIRYYLEEIENAWHLRRLTDLADSIRYRVEQPNADPAKIARWIDGEIASSSPERHDPRTFSVVAQEWLEECRQPTPPATVGTGLFKVDDTFGLWHSTELIVLAARPGVGKTSLALQVAEHQAAKGRTVLFVSLEMRDRELVQRALVRSAEIDGQPLRRRQPTSDELTKLEQAATRYVEDPFFVWSPPSATMSQIRAVAKRMRAKQQLSLIVVDYVSRIRSEDRNTPRHQQVSAVTWGCKTLAKECECPLLLLAQLNRESVKDTVPRLSHLAESGSLEQDADTVLFLHPDKDSVQCICAKNRHGETGFVHLHWEGKSTMFADHKPAKEHANYESAFDRYNEEF